MKSYTYGATVVQHPFKQSKNSESCTDKKKKNLKRSFSEKAVWKDDFISGMATVGFSVTENFRIFFFYQNIGKWLNLIFALFKEFLIYQGWGGYSEMNVCSLKYMTTFFT